jgi:alpha-mannosidase
MHSLMMERMMNTKLKGMMLATVMAAGAVGMQGQTPIKPLPKRDLTRQPTLYVVPYAHLDTQWNWNMQQSISEYLLKTLRLNFDYFQKYPDYIFNWTGSNRYRLMKEYYPSDYARMKEYVAEGRWFPGGSAVEENDVNLPSAESLFRQVLYSNEYFRKEFGKESVDYMLPDCFGFPASLPTILAHAGLRGFSTQKLNSGWQPAPLVGGPDSPEGTPEGIPFNVGVWIGPDGERMMAALNPGGYSANVFTDLSKAPVDPATLPKKAAREQDWVARLQRDGKATGLFADYRYVGTGDIGGAPDEESVRLLEAMQDHTATVLPDPTRPHPQGPQPEPKGTPVVMGDGPVQIEMSDSDQIFRDIAPDMTGRMPTYTGDLELINHSAGSLTSEAYHKRWNRENELLAGAAEEASVAAMWMGGRTYPQERLNDAWNLVLAGQFHDVAAGTASPRSYEFAQNDDLVAANQFAEVLTSATQAVASALNTEGAGIPIVVSNPLNIAREDVVTAALDFHGERPKMVRVMGPDGKPVLAQWEDGKVLFVAKAPSMGYAVYHVERGEGGGSASELKVTEDSLENARYRVKIDASGDVSSVFDKQLGRELLAQPMRLAISTDAPAHWPAWNMDFDQEQATPRAYVSGPVKMRIVENGPVRVAIEVTRETEGSTFAQTVRLSAGDAGNRVEFAEAIDWRTKAANLKAVFPLAATNKDATYSWEVGTIQRPTAFERQFEVGSHSWIDLTDQQGGFGATILTDVKNGSDKRDDHTIRLTLLRSPGYRPELAATNQMAHADQQNQDWGHHEIVFGLEGHAKDWRASRSYWQAYELSAPLEPFVTSAHGGSLGREFSLLKVSSPDVRVLALKKAEMSNDVVLRMVELNGEAAPDVRVKLAGPVVAARAANGQEEASGAAVVRNGTLETSFTAYQPQTFLLKLGAAPGTVAPVQSEPVKLKYDLAASSEDDTKSVGGFDAQGDALPAEMLPSTVSVDGVDLNLAPAGTGKLDAVIAKGQTVKLPAGDYNMVYVLAASADGDQAATFHVGAQADDVTVENWGGFIGQWDTRIWKDQPADIRKDWAVSANHAEWDLKDRGTRWWKPSYPNDYLGLRAGYVKPAEIAWYASHHHTAAGLNEPYEYSYLFVYALPVPAHSQSLTLPANENVRILAISVAKQEAPIAPARPLFDTLGRTEFGPMVPASKQ